MSERLIIRLGSNAQESISWLQFNDKAQEVIGSGVLSDMTALNQLTQQARSSIVQILVPGSDISYFEVAVPTTNRRQAIAAIPFMLEDELADDIEMLHFVYARSKGEKQGVYVCKKDKINHWLSWLTQADIAPNCLLPDYLALPRPQEHNIEMLQLDEQLLIRADNTFGYSVPVQWLDIILKQLSVDDEPLSIAHYDVNEAHHRGPHQWHAQPLVLPMLQLSSGLFKPALNMLVGEFEQNKQQNSPLTVWRGVAVAASLLVVLFFAQQFIQVNQLEQQQLALKKQSEAIYRQINPNVKRILKLKTRMKNEIAQLSGGRTGSELSAMLAQMQQAFMAVPTLKPASLKYDQRRNELRLQAQGDSYQQFEQFKQVLQGQYSVTMGAMNNNGDKVSGSLVVKVSS